MTTYIVLSAILLAVLAAILAVTLVRIFAKKRADRLKFIRGFKKGKCAIIYLVAIPLYWMGLVYGGTAIAQGLFGSITRSIALVVLNFEMGALVQLMADCIPFAVAVYVTFALVACNTLLFSLSVLHQQLWQANNLRRWRRAKGEKLLIVGLNDQSLWLYESERNRTKIITGSVSKEQATSLFFRDVNFLATRDPLREVMRLLDEAALDRRSIGTVVLNLKDDAASIDACKAICARLGELATAVQEDERIDYVTDLFSRINVYVFGAPAYESLYCKYEESSFGCLHYVNKYKQIALSTADRYPLSAFLPAAAILPDTTLAPDTALDVSFVGFGKTNRQIFLTSVANNQFLTKDKSGNLVLLPVRYHAYDKDGANSIQLNHTYLRYEHEVVGKVNEKDYLPLPSVPAVFDPQTCDVNDPAFYESFRKTCTSADVHLAVIACGSDLENVELAEKLLGKAREWGAKNFFVFVKVRSGKTSYPIFAQQNCLMLAPERTEVYDIEQLVADRLISMSKERNRIYALHSPKNAGKSRDEVRKLADYKWHVTMSQQERESNVYALLNLRTKLHLLGLDYTEGKAALTDDDYFARYASGKRHEGGKLVGMTEQDMTALDHSTRCALATQEHFRWNAYMLCRGTVPATRAQILTERKKGGAFTNGKSYALRRHGNLTTMEGLLAFRKLVAERDGIREEDADVIRYDYEMMDEAPWMLGEQGCALTERTENA